MHSLSVLAAFEDFFAAHPGRRPGRALRRRARPQPGRLCRRAGRATCRPRAHASLPLPASCRLRVVFAYAPTAARLRGLLSAACSAHPTPPSGLCERLRGRVSVMRHARPCGVTPCAWPSGLLPSPTPPRTPGPSASAGGKALAEVCVLGCGSPPQASTPPAAPQASP